MAAVTNYNGKTVLVAGAGRSGIAAARFLIARGARVILTDSKDRSELGAAVDDLVETTQEPGALELELGGHRPEIFQSCDFAVVSPGVPLALAEFQLCRKAGIPILAEVELAARHLRGKIVGVTGSNGKTTTTTLVSELLRGAGMKGFAAGNIGTPLTDFVDASTPEDVYAVELSSFQLEGIHDFRPCIGSILNITPDHLDRYKSYEEYVAAKRRIFMNQEQEDFAVLNADDPATASMAAEVKARPVFFSRLKDVLHGTFVRNERVIFRNPAGEKELFPVASIRLKGSHNLENVLAACAMAILAGAAAENIEEGISKFDGIEHRIEYVAEINGVQYYNDSKATNVDAAVKSIESFPENILLIAGGRNKGSDFGRLIQPVRQRVKRLILIGEAADMMRNALEEWTEASIAGTLQEAVKQCKQYARPGDTVLLAPACASFDMFRDYEHRGQVFKNAVRSEIQ